MNTPPSTARKRLSEAGWVYVQGWLPPGAFTRRVVVNIEAERPKAERIATEPKPMGRRRKAPLA